jgi:hypothetical protein
MVGLGVALCLAASCGGSPTAATSTPGSVTVGTGLQVLRVTQTGFTCTFNGGESIFPMVYTRVTVSQVGNEWRAVAATAAAGDVEIRFHQSGASRIAGSMPIEGTIQGQAVHLPELFVGSPSANPRMNFGSDGRTMITGYAFAPSPLTPTSGLDGIGMGQVVLSDNTGRSCGATTFSWGMAPQ